jgi:diaminopimelate decarboxylase
MASQQLVDQVLDWATTAEIRTPAFLFAPDTLHAGVAELRSRLGARISYATKANAHPRVLRELAPLVDEFNVTNLAHLDALLALDVEPARIAYLNPVCDRATVSAIAARGITRCVVDDERGLRLLLDVLGERARITLRLRPPDAGESARSVVRFGNIHELLPGLAKQAVEAGAQVEALSFFIGTAGMGMDQALPFLRGIEQLTRLRQQLEKAGIAAPMLNIGGGFPGSRQSFYREHPDFLDRIAHALPDCVDVICEPGRYLSEPSMAMLARVVADRTVAGRRLVYLDASAYGGLFETSFIEPEGPGVEIGLAARSGEWTPAAVLGPVMDSFDVIKRRAMLPPLREGELLVLPNVGAYAWGYTAPVEGLVTADVVELPPELAAGFANAWYGEAVRG